ncbi:MAG: hypothetical protein QM779_14970 [Propionicimonas sp.]|uniref:hypothetical protein n=1 Tax=Propionicimonas sp. TaxID=1955623 RepID=UPI003D0F1366
MDEFCGADARGTLGRLGELVRAQAAIEAEQVRAIAHLADVYGPLSADEASSGLERLAVHGAAAVQLGADGTPPISEFLALEIAPILRLSPMAAGLFLVDVLNCRARHPRLWQAVQEGSVRFWQAREVVSLVARAELDQASARRIDDAMADAVERVGWTRARRLLKGLIVAEDPQAAARRESEYARARFVHRTDPVDGLSTIVARLDQGDALRFEAMVARVAEILGSRGDSDDVDVRRAQAFGIMASPARALALLQSAVPANEADGHATFGDGSEPELPGLTACAGHTCGTITVDPDRLLPSATLVVHLSDTALMTGTGVARAEKLGPVPLQRLRALLGDTRLTVRPVFDPSRVAPVDCYEIPDRMRTAVLLRDPHEVFPYASRTSTGLDLDHTVPYAWGRDAPPGQTRPDNLGPLGRRVHRAKTHTGWRVRQPAPGFFAWTSPAGFHYLVGPHGTIAEPTAGAA